MRATTGVLGLALGWAAPARATEVCGEDTAAAVDATLTALWDAYRAVDEAGFDRVGKTLTAAVACLDEVPGAAQVARLHQGMALVSFVNGQTRASRRSLAAARMLDPGWRLDDTTFPDGHPFRDLWASANDPGPVERIGRIQPDRWIVDGVERDEAPVERAFLLQVADAGGAVVWSGYEWTADEIPDRGQADVSSPLSTPHVVWASLGLQGRLLQSTQVAADTSAWTDRAATAVGGGLGVQLRYTPLSVIGVEAEGSIVSPGDPVLHGGGQPSAHAALLLGGAVWKDSLQPWAALRLGGGVDQSRAWSGLDDPPEARVWTLPSALIGVEGGVRAKRLRAGAAVDVLLADFQVPWQARVRVDGGALVVGPLALEGALRIAAGGQAVEDVGAGVELGQRDDLDVRAVFAIAIWD